MGHASLLARRRQDQTKIRDTKVGGGKEKQTNHKGKRVYTSPTPLPTRGFETAGIQSASRFAKLAKTACICVYLYTESHSRGRRSPPPPSEKIGRRDVVSSPDFFLREGDVCTQAIQTHAWNTSLAGNSLLFPVLARASLVLILTSSPLQLVCFNCFPNTGHVIADSTRAQSARVDGAPQLRKCGNLAIQENLVIT